MLIAVKISATIAGIMSALSSAQQSEVKAWEEEILACEHTLMLQQEKDFFPGYSELVLLKLRIALYKKYR